MQRQAVAELSRAGSRRKGGPAGPSLRDGFATLDAAVTHLDLGACEENGEDRKSWLALTSGSDCCNKAQILLAGHGMSVIGLRPALAGDSEFCYQLHKAAMGEYVSAIWGWDEQLQRDFHDGVFNPGRWQIITADDKDVGMLDVEHRPGEIYLARIEILPSYQGRGIGTSLISALVQEAARNGQDLVLDVLTVNHRAQSLYQRLGLAEVTRHGDNNVKIAMRTVGRAKSA